MLSARAATPADAEWLLRLRNDPETRARSVNREPVAPSVHEAWLDMVFRDRTRRLMVVEGGDGQRVATHRLDGIGTESVEVSLTVAPEYRGLGLAAPVIVLALAHARREGAMDVWALIHQDNARSRRAFERAGFVSVVPAATRPGYLIYSACRPATVTA